jgi:hypothetical protein
MPDFMSQHGCQFGFGIEVGQDAPRDVNVAARQRKGIDLRAIQNGKVVFETGAMALCRQFLADPLDIGLQRRVGIDAVLAPDLAVVAVPELDLLGLGHEHEIRCPADGIGGATGSEARRRSGQKQGNQEAMEGAVTHNLNRAMLAWPGAAHAGAAGLWIA